MRGSVLLIERDPAEAETIRAALEDNRDRAPSLEWVRQLSDGVERVKSGEVGAILVDLFLPDCAGIATFERLWAVASDIPILVVCEPSDEPLATQAVERGAQDYLLKTHLDTYSLRHALRNMIDRKAAADALFLEKNRADVTLNSIGDAVLSTDLAGNVTYLNVVAERMTGWSRAEASGRPLGEVFHVIDGTTRKRAHNPMADAIRDNRPSGLAANSVLIRRDGLEAAIEDSAAPIHDRQGRVIGAVIVFHDVTAARAMTLKMSHLAHHDALTDLPNRVLLQDRLDRAIELARRHQRQLAVLFVDLDGFKPINDSLGHDVGDELLRSVASRLAGCIRSSDTVSRHGGDEFVVVLSEMEHASNAHVTARKILDAVRDIHRVAGHDLLLTASIGVSVYPNDGRDAETLLKNADMAMYQAKERGRGRFEFFQPEMNATAAERQSIERGLRRALEQQEFVLHYQPKMDLHAGVMIGAEALIRWRHPDLGILPAARFVPIAEASGLIVPIGQWVLREACRQTQMWQESGLRPIPVAVNISAAEFRNPAFLDGVARVLRETRLPPQYLELEMTETVLMAPGQATLDVLHGLKTLGVRLALDDFGTGYSNLSQLREFPIDALKVDESFVRDIVPGSQGAPLVVAVISLGKSLNQRVVAEGVETAEELAFLRTQRCDEAQGYFFSRPLPAAQYARLLTRSGPQASSPPAARIGSARS